MCSYLMGQGREEGRGGGFKCLYLGLTLLLTLLSTHYALPEGRVLQVLQVYRYNWLL